MLVVLLYMLLEVLTGVLIAICAYSITGVLETSLPINSKGYLYAVKTSLRFYGVVNWYGCTYAHIAYVFLSEIPMRESAVYLAILHLFDNTRFIIDHQITENMFVFVLLMFHSRIAKQSNIVVGGICILTSLVAETLFIYYTIFNTFCKTNLPQAGYFAIMGWYSHKISCVYASLIAKKVKHEIGKYQNHSVVAQTIYDFLNTDETYRQINDANPNTIINPNHELKHDDNLSFDHSTTSMLKPKRTRRKGKSRKCD